MRLNDNSDNETVFTIIIGILVVFNSVVLNVKPGITYLTYSKTTKCEICKQYIQVKDFLIQSVELKLFVIRKVYIVALLYITYNFSDIQFVAKCIIRFSF